VTFAFDNATAVRKTADGRYEAEVLPSWDINGNANGGYLFAFGGRAMREHSGRRDPYSVTAHYLAPVQAGPISVEVDTVKSGKLLTTMNASIVVNGRTAVRFLGAFGEMADVTNDQFVAATPPEIPPFEECVPRNHDGTAMPVEFANRFNSRIHPDDTAFLRGETNGIAVMRGWFEFGDGRPIDTLSLLTIADSFAPPVLNVPMQKVWVPTIELTVHVRAVPVGARVACVFRSRVIQGGLTEEDGEIWDQTGNLVAHSRQLALLWRA
jgi:acyl-CoA thioesterase